MKKKSVKEEIALIKPEIMPISELVFDKTNPNVMTPEKRESLGKFMRVVGFRIPVQIRKQNNKIIDGANRTQWMKENNFTKVLVQKIDCTEPEAKEYRILFNELSGELDENKYAKELQYLKKHGLLDEFAELMAEEKRYFEEKIETFKESEFIPDEPIIDSIEEGMDTLSINFKFEKPKDYEYVMTALKKNGEDMTKSLLKIIGATA